MALLGLGSDKVIYGRCSSYPDPNFMPGWTAYRLSQINIIYTIESNTQFSPGGIWKCVTQVCAAPVAQSYGIVYKEFFYDSDNGTDGPSLAQVNGYRFQAADWTKQNAAGIYSGSVLPLE